jgi:ABC-2 type transport system permease protein
MTVVADPNSTLATWASIIPFTSPLIMMARLPFGVSVIEIVASLALLYASTLLMVWFSAKIYRVGIFMYGKKPTFKELIRWARYK